MSINSNFDKVGKGFTDYATSDLHMEIDEELNYLAELQQHGSEEKAPRDTGFMASNIIITQTGEHSVTCTAIAEYSGFVDQGTVNMAAQPFFTDTLTEIESSEIPNIEKKLGASIDAKFSVMGKYYKGTSVNP